MKNTRTIFLKGLEVLSLFGLVLGAFLIPLSQAKADVLPASVSMTASPSTIACGQSAHLNWNSVNATLVTITPGIGTVNPSGNLDVFPTQSTTYTITGTNSSGGFGTVFATVQVTGSCGQTLPTLTLTADQTSITSGNSTIVRWTTGNNPTSCVATGGSNGWSGSRDVNGGVFSTGVLYGTTAYAMTCTNSAGSVSSSATVSVGTTGQRPTVNLTADQTNVSSGGSTTIRWNPTNSPDYCTASSGTNGWSGSRSISGGSFYTGALYGTTTFTMLCSNNNGSSSESVTVTTNGGGTSIDSPTVNLTADQQNIASGSSTTIRWNPANNPSYCNATNGSNGWPGSRSPYSGSFYTGILYSTTTYTMTCTNSAGYLTDSVTVTVGGGLYYGTCQDPNATNYRNSLPCQYQQIYPVISQPTVNIYADSTNLAYNGATYIRWNTTNATYCSASGGSTGWSGTKSIGPGSFYTGSLNGSRTYTIVCNNNTGSSSDSVTVSVRGQVIPNPTPIKTSYVLLTSSVDRNQPIVPTIDNTRPHPGDEINYTVGYQNIGTGAITNLVLRIDLPYEVNYVSSNPTNPNISGNVLIFNLGTLKANGQGVVTARVRVGNNVPYGTNLNFPATLSYTDPAGQYQSVGANVSAQVWAGDIVPTNTNTTTNLGANAFLAGFLPGNVFGWMIAIIVILAIIYFITGGFVKETTIVHTSTNHGDHA